jgi:hypothetical protein
MKLHAADRARAGILWRYCAISLVCLLIVVALPACSSGGGTPNCSGDSESYQGRCLPHITANYLKCIEGRGFSVSSEVSTSVTLPTVADSTFKVAYKRSKEEDSTVTLQIVHDCLTLAEQNATSGTDRGTAQQYAQQATQYIGVIKQRLPAIELDPSGTLNCGSAAVNAQVTCNVTIKSTGVVALQITNVEVTGANSGDFRAGDECTGQSLDPDQSCMMTVQFQPSASGDRNAALVIHQNLPPPDHGTPLQLVGTGTGPPPGVHTLTVTVDPSAAGGTVTSNPPGIDCPGTCNSTFGDGTDITLTATYGQGSGQTLWDGCDTTNGDSCTVHLTADRAVTAHLPPPPIAMATGG